MFGSEEALREGLPQYHIDFREKLSNNPEIRWTDRLVLDGTWAGNLYQFYVRVVQKLSADLKLPFQLDNNLFRKGETVVHVAIREALVNALIHADYEGQGGIVIEKYHDRFEFSNPGSLLISFEQLLSGNISECRNKSLQTMFTMIGAAEKAGSGVDKIKLGWESQHWRSPGIRESVQPDRVLWILPMISLIPDESLDRLKKMFVTTFKDFDQLEIQALVTADIEGFVDNIRMQQITAVHTTDVTKLLQNLVSKGALTQDGQGRWTRYKIPSHCVHKDNDSVHNSVHKSQTPDNQIELLNQIAEVARQNKRLFPEKMEQVILDLCRGRWLSRKQLADFLKRNPDGLRSRFLTQMVRHGLLQLRYPDKPNRVDQAYTTSEKQNSLEIDT